MLGPQVAKPVQPGLAPQKARSVSGSMQPPPQSMRPAPQVETQAPLEHTFPGAQGTPQAPQLVLSDWTETQLSPQSRAAPRHGGSTFEQAANVKATSTTR